MLIPFQIKSTIDARRSARSYQMKSVDRVVMETIKDFCDTFVDDGSSHISTPIWESLAEPFEPEPACHPR